jgi:predicted O-methyltransferase YrrM
MLREYAIAARNFLLGGNLSTLRFAKRPGAAVFYVNECLFTARLLNPNGDLPQRDVWDVLGSDSEIPVILKPALASDWFLAIASWQADLIALMMLTQIKKPATIFEIGTLHGCSALHFALNAPNAKIFTLDLPLNQKPLLNTTRVDTNLMGEGQKRTLVFDHLHQQNRITCLYGDSATFDFSPFHNSVDLFFIDGAHHYEYVRNDTLKALQCVKPGGVVAWHDYGRCGVNGVSRWLNEFRAQGNNVQRIRGGSLAFMVKA